MEEYTYRNYTYKSGDTDGTMLFNQYNVLIDLLEWFKPKRICELGSGQSTLIFQQYKKTHEDVTLFSIEHDPVFRLRRSTILCPLIQNTAITIGDKTYFNINRYENFEEWLQKQNIFDFVLIDGPLSWGFREKYDYSRIQTLSFIEMNKMANNSYILYHDSERNGAQATLQELQNLLTNKGFIFQKNITPSPYSVNLAQLTCYKLHHD